MRRVSTINPSNDIQPSLNPRQSTLHIFFSTQLSFCNSRLNEEDFRRASHRGKYLTSITPLVQKKYVWMRFLTNIVHTVKVATKLNLTI